MKSFLQDCVVSVAELFHQPIYTGCAIITVHIIHFITFFKSNKKQLNLSKIYLDPYDTH